MLPFFLLNLHLPCKGNRPEMQTSGRQNRIKIFGHTPSGATCGTDSGIRGIHIETINTYYIISHE